MSIWCWWYVGGIWCQIAIWYLNFPRFSQFSGWDEGGERVAFVRAPKRLDSHELIGDSALIQLLE